MKKLLAAVVALCMMLALAVPVIAATDPADETDYQARLNQAHVGKSAADPGSLDNDTTGKVVEVGGVTAAGPYAFWHFVTGNGEAGSNSKENGNAYANIYFWDENGDLQAVENVPIFAAGNSNNYTHFGVRTPVEWTLADGYYYGLATDTFNLSHSGVKPGGDGSVQAKLTVEKFFDREVDIEEVQFAITIEDIDFYDTFTAYAADGFFKDYDFAPEVAATFVDGMRGYVEEINAPDWKTQNEDGDDVAQFWFTLVANGDDFLVVFDDSDTDNYVIIMNTPKFGSLEVTDDVMETYYEEYHKAVYREYNYGTLVSFGNFTLTETEAPAGVIGDLFLGNGMTYLKIDTNALPAEGSDIAIAESNKPGNKLNAAWNTPVGPDAKSYNIKLVNGDLVIDSELPDFGVVLTDKAYGTKDNPVKNIKHDGKTNYNVAAADTNGDGIVYLFFHIGSAHWFDYTDILGCTFDYNSEAKTREYTGTEDVFMTVTRAVMDAETGLPAVDPITGAPVLETVYSGDLGLVEDLEPGTYTVKIFVGALEIASGDVAVVAGENTEVDFGALLIPAESWIGAPAIFCDVDCPDTCTYCAAHGCECPTI